MNKKNFAEEIRRRTQNRLGKEVTVELIPKNKNNNIKVLGLRISTENPEMYPVICLEGYYEYFCENVKTVESYDYYLNEIEDRILENYKNSITNVPKIKADFWEYEQIKNKIVFRLINLKKNKEILKTQPHLIFCDLAIVFEVVVEEYNDCCLTYRVDNSMIKRWGVDKDSLYDRAYLNTRKLFEIEVFSVNELYQKLYGKQESCYPMYAMTNKNMSWGAGTILYTESIKQIADSLDSDLWILPSSVHEVILLKADVDDISSDTSFYLQKMVKEINATQVEPEEVLSDNIYYYNRNANEISIVS